MVQNTAVYALRKLMVVAVVAAAATGAAVTSARANTITFDDGSVAVGATLSTQYASQGVTFVAGGGAVSGVINPTATTQGFATNTNLLIDTLEAGAAAPLSGLVLRTFNGWIAEDGDPVFTMTFASAITALSIDFGANASSQPAIFAVNPTTGVATTVASSVSTTINGTLTAVGIPAGAKTFIVVPGNYSDYVAVDNIVFTAAVPEPSTVAAAALGLGVLGLVVRRQRRGASV